MVMHLHRYLPAVAELRTELCKRSGWLGRLVLTGKSLMLCIVGAFAIGVLLGVFVNLRYAKMVALASEQ